MGRVHASVLAEARAAGLEVRARDGQLVVRGPRRAEALAQRVLELPAVVLAALAAEDGEVAWRVETMWPQVPSRGPIPVLIAREGPTAPGHCVSCGDRIGGGRTTRCGPCGQAVWLVLHEVREGTSE